MNPNELRIRVGIANAQRTVPSRMDKPLTMPWCKECQQYHHPAKTLQEYRELKCSAPPPIEDHPQI